MTRLLLLLALGTCIVSCSPVSNRSLTKQFKDTEKQFQDHTGFALFDIAANKTVFEYNSEKYFTPASNTKIFTFYAALKLLGDSLPAFKYEERNDSLIVWGTGDPSLLNRNVYYSPARLLFCRHPTENCSCPQQTFKRQLSAVDGPGTTTMITIPQSARPFRFMVTPYW